MKNNCCSPIGLEGLMNHLTDIRGEKSSEAEGKPQCEDGCVSIDKINHILSHVNDHMYECHQMEKNEGTIDDYEGMCTYDGTNYYEGTYIYDETFAHDPFTNF